MDWQTIQEQWSTPIAIGAILLVVGAIRVSLKFVTRKVVKTIVNGVKSAKASGRLDAVVAEQRLTQRTKTIASVLDNIATWTITVTGIVMILSELGVDVGALIAVSTILGAAIGFGAQSLVKDILAGIFIVFEDQYGVGDWVDLGDVDGEVEKVGLRITELRDIHGTLWFVRNGEIVKVGNSSQEWATALLDLEFAYDNDVDQVQEIIKKVGATLRKTKPWNRDIVGDLEILGMQRLSGEQFVLRVSIRTLPNRQWAVNREMRAQLKTAFDQSGVNLLSASKIKIV
jgi:moderate conductance mechanosensitive channel